MIRTGLIAILIAAFATTAMSAPGFKRKRQEVRTRTELQLLSHADLANLRVGAFDPARVRPSIHRLTDILLILSARGSDIDAVLRLPNGQRPTYGRALFRARVFAVTNGLIHADAAAWCSGWQNDTSRCELDCDGGTFQFSRLPSMTGRNRLDLKISDRTNQSPANTPGFSINACQYEAPHQLIIIPAPGKHAVPLAFQKR